MCGIVAMISKRSVGFSYKDKAIFHQMLYADALRGMDSTGIFGVNAAGNLKMMKAALPASLFQMDKDYSKFLDTIFTEQRIMVGHNRSATKGSTTDENAHPFIVGNTCLVHNGTLFSHKHLGDKDVDSHAICESMDTRGYEKTIPDLHGAYALIWYDAKTKKLHAVRNKERPLWIVENNETVYIASEDKMLDWVLSRNLEAKQVTESRYFSTDSIYTWDLDKLEKSYTTSPVPTKKEFSYHFPVATQPVGNNKVILLPKDYGRKKDSGKASSVHCYLNYNMGDTVIFEHVSNSETDGNIVFRGNTIDGRATQVVAHANRSGKIPHMELEYLIDESSYLTGEVAGTSQKNGKTTLILSDVRAANVYKTVTGARVTQEQLDESSQTCDKCGSWIDGESDNGLFFARIKGGSIKSLLCPSCVEKHPTLSELIKETDVCNLVNDISSYPTISEAEVQEACAMGYLSELDEE